MASTAASSTPPRATAPRLSKGDIIAAHNVPAEGKLSTIGPSFLTPPNSDPAAFSPPPKIDAPDYLSVRKKRRQQRRRKRAVRQLPSKEQTGSKVDTLPLTANLDTIFDTHSDEGSLRSDDTRSDWSGSHHSGQSPSLKISVTPPKPGNDPIKRSDTINRPRAANRVAADHDYSTPKGVFRTISWNLARMRRASVNTGDDVHTVDPANPRIQYRALTGLDRSLSLQSPEDDGTEDSSKLDMPTTITLRKASAALQRSVRPDVDSPMGSQANSKSQSGSEEEEYVAASTELVTFRSSFAKGGDRDSVVQRDDIKLDQEPTQITRMDSFKKLMHGGEPLVRRQTTPAAPTLTFTNVHIATGTFASPLDPPSRRPSASSSLAARRLSIVHFRSRDSVHEIIWMEDESSSESSSKASLATPEANWATPGGSEDTPLYRPKTRAPRGNSLPGRLRGTEQRSDEDIFNWMWGKPSASHVIMPRDTLKYSKRQSSTHGTRKGIFHEDTRTARKLSAGSSVISFPPLQSRASTPDGQQQQQQQRPNVKRTKSAIAEELVAASTPYKLPPRKRPSVMIRPPQLTVAVQGLSSTIRRKSSASTWVGSRVGSSSGQRIPPVYSPRISEAV